MKLNLSRNVLFIFSLVITLSFISFACGAETAKAPEPQKTNTLDVPRDTPIPGKIGTHPSPNSTTNSTSPTTTSADGLRPVDQKILTQLSTPASGDKIKDAFSKESFKVNFYRENGEATWSRLKVDLNRNEKWDEKWDLANGQPVKRQVASKDDENYDQTFVWKSGKWEAEK
ncbi:MAG: hypothetical protein HY819_12060 [Acidobacteria bacterium]|nr:hypothetical protein [Acidobacteriota bacterium]